MKKHMRLRETLTYYDGIQLFLGEDQLGVAYICVLVESRESGELFLCAPASPARIDAFRHGDLDLLAIYAKPEDELYTVEIGDFSQPDFALAALNMDVPPAWLPAPGFICPIQERADGWEQIVAESKERRRAIIHLRLNPPEARNAAKITVLHLSQALKFYQKLVRRAYSRAAQNLTREVQGYLSQADQSGLEAFAFSPGSFTVHLQSEAEENLLGDVPISTALRKIDEITASLGNVDSAIAAMRTNKGHLAAAYLDLLDFMLDAESPISYKWAVPEFDQPLGQSVSIEQMRQAYSALRRLEELKRETVMLTGRLMKVDLPRNTWTLLSETDGKTYDGHLSKGDGLSLSGAIMETQRYRFTCEERIDEVAGTGRETKRLRLVAYEHLGTDQTSVEGGQTKAP